MCKGRATVMTVLMALEEEVVRIICVHGPQSRRTGAEKECFMMIWGVSGIRTAKKKEKGEKRKMMYSAGVNETEIDFVLVGKGNRK